MSMEIKSKNTKLHTDFFAIYISYLVAKFISNTFFERISSPLFLSSYHVSLRNTFISNVYSRSQCFLNAYFFVHFQLSTSSSFPESFTFCFRGRNWGDVVESGWCWLCWKYKAAEIFFPNFMRLNVFLVQIFLLVLFFALFPLLSPLFIFLLFRRSWK